MASTAWLDEAHRRLEGLLQPQADHPASGAEAESDLLYACLERVGRAFGRPTSRIVLLAGLPSRGTLLTSDLFVRAAERIGLVARWRSASFHELTEADLPALVWRRDGRPLILEELDGEGGFRAFHPETGALAPVPLESCDALLRREAISISPDLSGAAGVEAAGIEAAAAPPHWLWGIARVFWRSYLYVVAASVFINLLAVASPLFTMNVYDRVLPNKAIPTLWVLAAGVLIAFAFDFVLRHARAHLIDYVARRIDLRVSSLLLERVLNARLSRQGASTGLMTQRLQDYEFVREFLTSNTTVFFIDLVFSVVFLAVIFTIAPWLAVVPALVLVLMAAVGVVIQRLINRELQRSTATTALRQSLLVEIVGSLETVKSLRGEGSLLRRWDTVTRDVSTVQERIKSHSAFATNLAYFLQLSVTLVTVIVGAYLFERGDITTGAIIAAVMLGGRAVAPAGQIALTLARARQAASAFRSLDAVMALPDERSERRLVVSRPVGRGRIEFRQARFSYQENGRPVLAGLDLAIEPGERVAILGRIGVGKTTLGRLVARFHELDGGELLIDGVDVRQYHPHEVRRAVTFVGQDADLFTGSIRDNLLMARPDASDEELIGAASLAGVDEFAAAHPLGYDRPVGERGGLLSSGQRQMVGLARAFLARGQILFLDDPTSSMDMASERQFVSRLKSALAPGSTLIVTTHRNAVLRRFSEGTAAQASAPEPALP